MTSSIDSVKQLLVIHMLSSSTMNCYLFVLPLPLVCHQLHQLVCTSFRFKKRQKKFLFKAFADGEHSGKKASPEEVHQNMRNFFDPVDYCSVCQIKFLFSRWSWDLQSSTLPDLAEKITSKGNFCLLKQIINK